MFASNLPLEQRPDDGDPRVETAEWLRLPVFPCRDDNKAPTCPNGFKDAQTEPAKIRELWRRYPGPLVGVPTGEASGIDVLDVDPRHGGHIWFEANRERLPETRIHRTRSGGLHILFKYLPGLRNCEGISKTGRGIAPGIDVRATGGYVIWWPMERFRARGDLNNLAEWPLWLLPKLMEPPRPPLPVYPKAAGSKIFRPEYVQAAIERELDEVAGAADGRRNKTLLVAAVKLGTLVGAKAIKEPKAVVAALIGAGQSNGLTERECRRTVKNGLDFGVWHPRPAPNGKADRTTMERRA
jgi:hypothetical protein